MNDVIQSDQISEEYMKTAFMELLTWVLQDRPEWIAELARRSDEFCERIAQWSEVPK